MKVQWSLAVSMVLKGENFRNSLKGSDTKRKTTFKSLGLLLGIDACRGIQLGLSKLKVSPIKIVSSEKSCVNQPLRICNSDILHTPKTYLTKIINQVAKVRRRCHET